jgi:hypothetical protein
VSAPLPPPEPSTHTSRLLGLVRKLIDFGKQLAATFQQRAASTTPADDLTRPFGTPNIPAILASIARGLQRAALLEVRVTALLTREQAAPSARTAPSPRQPRLTAQALSAPEPRPARVPTAGDIEAEVRRRPIGAVLADICRDLGIVPSNPLWWDLVRAINQYDGNLAKLVRDNCKRLSAWLYPTLFTEHPTAPDLPREMAPATGPP